MQEISCSEDERVALHEALAPIPIKFGVRRVMGDLIAETYASSHPALHERALDFLDLYKGSPFTITPLKVAIAYTAFFGAGVYPAKDLRESTNRVMADALVFRSSSPFVKTFLKVADEDWGVFVTSFEKWGPLFSNMRHADVERVGPGEVHVVYMSRFSPALSFVTVGMLQGLMELFGQSGSVDTVDLEDDILVNRMQW